MDPITPPNEEITWMCSECVMSNSVLSWMRTEIKIYSDRSRKFLRNHCDTQEHKNENKCFYEPLIFCRKLNLLAMKLYYKSGCMCFKTLPNLQYLITE